MFIFEITNQDRNQMNLMIQGFEGNFQSLLNHYL